jgi:PAS domain S-box-containing protein
MTQRKLVLAVDDEPQNRDLLQAVLQSLGHDCVLAENGPDALNKLKLGVDLVLLDAMMPLMDGFEVAKRIRQDPCFGDIPIIMVTVLSGKEHRLRAAECGANDFITKPIDIVELRIRAASLLKMKDAQDVIKRHRAELEEEVAMRTAALRESEERFRYIFEAAHDCIFMKDDNFRYTHVNPAMLRLMDLQEEDIVGKTDGQLFDPDSAKQVRDLETRVLKGMAVETEHTLNCKGRDIALSVIRFPLRGTAGEIIGTCGIGRDVTERRLRLSEPRMELDCYESKTIRATLEQVLLAAKTDSIVLFLGESGSGKDHLARYLHDHSHRAGGPFFAINCAALPSELAESELFGHEHGAFTGTRGRKRGLVELAEGGTLLLNEIGELSLILQAKLLMFLDTQTFTRIGGEKSIAVNARILAATNRDLAQEVAAGRFRSDLFYRINVFAVAVPPLRERREDIPVIARALLVTIAKKLGRQYVPILHPDTIERLCCYHWPGNIRELRNVLERALILCKEKHILPEHIEAAVILKVENPTEELPSGPTISEASSMKEQMDQTKTRLIAEALRNTRGNVSKAARSLGVSRDVLRHQMKRLNIEWS